MSDTQAPDLERALHHEGALRRLAASLCRNPADIDDAVQHTMTQAALGRRAAGTPLPAFLRRTLRNHVSNLRKLGRRRRAREAEAGRSEWEAPVDEMVARDELRRRVSQAVLDLPEPYRTTVWLRWFEDLSAADVAERTGVPLNTTRTRLQRGHEMLRERLDRDYGDRRWLLAAAAWGEGPPRTTHDAVPPAPTASPSAILAVGAAALAAVAGLAIWALGPGSAPPSAAPLAGSPAPERNVRDVSAGSGPTRAPVPSAPGLRFLTADGAPLVDAPVWFWTGDHRPLWTRRARPGRATPGLDPQRDAEPPATSGRRTDASGRIRPPVSAEALTAVSVRFAPSLWYSIELPVDGPLVMPATAVVSARVDDAPDDTELEAVFEAVIGESNSDSLRHDVRTPTGDAVVWVGECRIRGAASAPLTAVVLHGQRTALARVYGHGFEAERERQVGVAPCEFVCRSVAPAPRIEVVVLEPDGSRTAQTGYALLPHPEHIARRGWLDGGVVTFDSHAPESYSRIVVRTADGRTAAREFAPPEGPGLRVTLSLADAVEPLRVALALGDDEPARVWLEASVSNPFWDLGRYADPHFGFGAWEFGRGPSGSVWIAGLPDTWKQLFVATRTGRLVRIRGNLDQTAPRVQWEPAGPPVDIDTGAYFDAAGAPPEASIALEVRLPYVDERQYGDRTFQWKELLVHRRDPEARVLVESPVWEAVRLPAALPWRILVRADHLVVREFQRLL